MKQLRTNHVARPLAATGRTDGRRRAGDLVGLAGPPTLPIWQSLLTTCLPCLVGLALVLLTGRVSGAGSYAVSAHAGSGTPGNGLSRTSTTTNAPGSCAHCHEQHASMDGSEVAPAGGPDPYLGMALEQDLCLACHTAAGSLSDSVPTPDDIKTDSTRTHGHAGTLSDTLHRSNENFATFAASPHVECTDCHNPHVARKGNHTVGPRYQTANGNLIDNTGTGPSPLEGVPGAAQGYDGASNWSAPTQPSYVLQTATKEYEICFKCHSGANPNWAAWDGDGAAAWSDVGQEFNFTNKSFHPVAAALNGAGSGSTMLNPSQLANGWSPGDTLYCTDCHASASAVAGPHGSATKWMLAGPNTAWPYTLATNNGTDTGTFFTLAGTTANLFCMNCHPNPTSNNSTNVHRQEDHNGTPCVGCHIRVPHGGKVSRLINANDDGAGTLPGRYFPKGVIDLIEVPRMIRFTKSANKDNYDTDNCQATCHHSGGTEKW